MNSRSKKQQGVVKVSTSFLRGKNSHFNHNSFVIYKLVKSLKILRTWKISMVLDAASSQFLMSRNLFLFYRGGLTFFR